MPKLKGVTQQNIDAGVFCRKSLLVRSGDRAGLVPKAINTQPAFKMKSRTVSYKEQFKDNYTNTPPPPPPQKKRETEKKSFGTGTEGLFIFGQGDILLSAREAGEKCWVD